MLKFTEPFNKINNKPNHLENANYICAYICFLQKKKLIKSVWLSSRKGQRIQHIRKSEE